MSIRTTLTLDDDVVVKLREESKAQSLPFRQVVNTAIRSGLIAMRAKPEPRPFKIEPVSMGTFPGLNYDNIAELIEWAEGETAR